MSRAFQRILRLRSLLEELSRLELERHVQQAAKIERSVAGENMLLAAGRREFLSSIANDVSAGADSTGEDQPISLPAEESRALAKASQEVAALRIEKLQQLSQIEAGHIAERSLEFHLRRKERHQVQTVLDRRAMEHKIQQERREQRDLDDWYAMREARKRRPH